MPAKTRTRRSMLVGHHYRRGPWLLAGVVAIVAMIALAVAVFLMVGALQFG